MGCRSAACRFFMFLDEKGWTIMKRMLTVDYLSNRCNCRAYLSDDGNYICVQSNGNTLYFPNMTFCYPVESYSDGDGGCLLFGGRHNIDQLPYDIGFDFRAVSCHFMIGKYVHDEEGDRFYLVPPSEATDMLVTAEWEMFVPDCFGRFSRELQHIHGLRYFKRTKSYSTFSFGTKDENSFNFYVLPIGWQFCPEDVDPAEASRIYEQNAQLVREQFTKAREALIAKCDLEERQRIASIRFKEKYYSELESIKSELDKLIEEKHCECGHITLCDDFFYLDGERYFYLRASLKKARTYLAEKTAESHEAAKEVLRQASEKAIERAQALEAFKKLEMKLQELHCKYHVHDKIVSIEGEPLSYGEREDFRNFALTLDGLDKLRSWIMIREFKERSVEHEKMLEIVARNRSERLERLIEKEGIPVLRYLHEAGAGDCEYSVFSMFSDYLLQGYECCKKGVYALIVAARHERTVEEAKGLSSKSHKVRMRTIRDILLKQRWRIGDSWKKEAMDPDTVIILSESASEWVARGLI